MEAVSSVLQSSIVDKYGKPFAQKTQKIVENLDMTVEKQDVVVEKQDEIGKKVKNVINNLDKSSSNFSDAFTRSSDGLKELSMGFIDIKGTIEEVSKKFQALNDFFAPIAEIGSFLLMTSLGQRLFGGKKKDDEEKSPDEKLRDAFGDERSGLGKFFDGIKNAFSKLFIGFKAIVVKVALAFKTLFVSMLPEIAKFLLFGGLFLLAAVGVGKLISALGGWELLKIAVDGLQSLFTKFKVSMNSVIMFLDDWTPGKLISDESRQEKEQFNNREKNKSFLEKRINQDAAEVGEIMTNEALSDEEKIEQINLKKLVTPDSTITDTGAIVNESGERIDYRPGTEDSQAFLINKDIQADLDMLAIKSAQMRQKLDTQLERAKKSGDKEEIARLEKSIEASDNFMAEYDKTYGEGAFAKTMADYGEFVSSRNAFQDRSAGRFLSIRDGTDIREFNDAGSNYSRFVLNAARTGDIIKDQLDRNETAVLDANAKGTFASVMAPSLTQQITSVYENKVQPQVSEAISK